MKNSHQKITWDDLVENPNLLSEEMQQLILDVLPNGFNFYVGLRILLNAVKAEHNKDHYFSINCEICDALLTAQMALDVADIDTSISLDELKHYLSVGAD